MEKLEFKLAIMQFLEGTEFIFYNNTKRIFILVDCYNNFLYKGTPYETDLTLNKWAIGIDILQKIGFESVKKTKVKNAYTAITCSQKK